MSIEYFILIAIAIISILSMIYIPKEKIRTALVAFLAFQSLTWATSIILVQKGMVKYPVREFAKASNVNFIPQFLFYPALFMWFALLFPKEHSMLFKIAHYIIFTSIMLWFSYFIYEYTNIYKPTNPDCFSFLRTLYGIILIQYGVCHLYVSWLFKKENSIQR